jgi:hypothetical protein
MQADGHLHNLGIVFRRVLAHQIQEIAVDMLIKTQAKVDDIRRESPKSEITMHIEMGIAHAAILGLLAMGAWICFLKAPDWIASIHRLQDML